MTHAQWYFLSGAMVGASWMFLTPLPTGSIIQQGALGFVVGIVVLFFYNIVGN